MNALVNLLPTPAVNGHGHGHGKSLHVEAARLLPTPVVTDSSDSARHTTTTGIAHPGTSLTDAIRQDWGQYAAAIHHWESLTRPAPDPTETGPKGNPRLSDRFSEWLMGLPAGWVTDVPGITRNEALKALGNGVVPQQCAAALRWLLAGAAAEGVA